MKNTKKMLFYYTKTDTKTAVLLHKTAAFVPFFLVRQIYIVKMLFYVIKQMQKWLFYLLIGCFCALLVSKTVLYSKNAILLYTMDAKTAVLCSKTAAFVPFSLVRQFYTVKMLFYHIKRKQIMAQELWKFKLDLAFWWNLTFHNYCAIWGRSSYSTSF